MKPTGILVMYGGGRDDEWIGGLQSERVSSDLFDSAVRIAKEIGAQAEGELPAVLVRDEGQYTQVTGDGRRWNVLPNHLIAWGLDPEDDEEED